ncbi:hypothetical protein BCR41DRAFT_356711 [Lobosporangium transversale]|uniref:Protein HGH1 N-terminal domain-containing protein n=1 Tax=Lobosporangium transversale TaxID=64571 RepID=A0A1Y2GIY6_9FUNG|nr:hypothetical protein BCR41DRAFT_357392 [Lobosporangium transversale]XP_021879754.1 hypothetical protein BCR41DRAFT_356711 [Lobosporangium transversale]ORZ11034.1 hypothetical protein BCR41DRAFT_357392 [Lobosporangium transversale]ORZ11657.1 hypothetical protein BCR41DRAFT_356711 [Lobosporangium transversale]|eukprot:XP_021879551.1 hypothetical protein BCR41DRAFT_357392 [Lobosporangium transversale]
MEAQIEELLPFLHDARMEVRQIAIQNIVSFTPSTSEFFKAIAHDALRSLINLSGETVICNELDDEEFIKHLIFNIIISKTNILGDLGSMLLSNMCKNDKIANKILNMTGKPVEGLTVATSVVGQLADIFLKGNEKNYNPQCNYDFLASVFATLATIPLGRTQLFAKDSGGLSPLSKIVCFTEHPNLIRRGGVITTIKNASFAVESHPALLDESDINVLPYILLPLCGPEEFDLDDMEGMPEDIQLLPPTKKREADAHLRETLLEALILLTTTRPGRITCEHVQQVAEQIVNMLMRDEAGAEITEIDDTATKPPVVEDDEDTITEV